MASHGQAGRGASASVAAVVRIRPKLTHESDASAVMDGSNGTSVVLRQRGAATSFEFDGVFGPATSNLQVFEGAGVPRLLDQVLAGHNATVFAYGITSSGKTFTMSGSPSDPGIIGRSVQHLFARIAATPAEERRVSVTCSYLEIYNEKVFDLLEPKEADLVIREDLQRRICVAGLAARPVRSVAEFAALFERGCAQRRSAPTALNEQSSRSHAVLTLTVMTRDKSSCTEGKLHLCDLAGSEDNRHTGNTGMRMTESSSINTSLFTLGLVVDALRSGRGRVPYRDSKLTRFLQDSLGGSSFGLVIANVAPGETKAHETNRTLNFASKSREVVNVPVAHVVALPPPPPPAPLQRSLSSLAPSSSAAAAPPVPLVRGASFLRHDVMEKLAHRAASRGERPNATLSIPPPPPPLLQQQQQPASPSGLPVLTPLTHSRALEQIRDRAAVHEQAGELDKAVAIYQGALSLVGEDNAFIQGRLAMVRLRIKDKENEKEADDGADDDAYEPPKAAAAKKRERNGSSKSGSQTKKIKSPLADVQVPAGVAERLLALCNQGTVAQLVQLQGVGKKRADAIVARRNEAPFTSLSDLAHCGFGKKMIQNFSKRNIHVADVVQE